MTTTRLRPDTNLASRVLLPIVATLAVMVAACVGDRGNDPTGGGRSSVGAKPGVGPTGPNKTKAGGTKDDGKDCDAIQVLDPANFVDPTLNTNAFQPLKPGIQWVRGGTTLVGNREVPHSVISTMTDVIRMIEGVRTVAMFEESTDSGEVAQVGIDYLALDKDRNVWILGGYTEEYEGGQYTTTEDAWLGTSDGSTIGILAPAEVTAGTAVWCIGGAPGDDPSVGAPVAIGRRECVAFGCYDDVRVVQEGDAGAPDNEHKYYASGVGVIRNVPLNASLHKDRFELLNFVELSPEGLAEISQRLLDLEAHARETSPDAYRDAPKSQRAG